MSLQEESLSVIIHVQQSGPNPDLRVSSDLQQSQWISYVYSYKSSSDHWAAPNRAVDASSTSTNEAWNQTEIFIGDYKCGRASGRMITPTAKYWYLGGFRESTHSSLIDQPRMGRFPIFSIAW